MAHPIIEQIKKDEKQDAFAMSENVVIVVGTFKGKQRVDVRKWWFSKKEETWNRSKNGLNLDVDEWNDFVAMVQEADEWVQKQLK